jgi:hypothetical protein
LPRVGECERLGANYASTRRSRTARGDDRDGQRHEQNELRRAASVTCYTCHRGARKPTVIPSLAAQYGEPPAEDPDTVEAFEGVRVTATADQIIDKYVQRSVGCRRSARSRASRRRGRTRDLILISRRCLSTCTPRQPNLRALVVHTATGDAVTAYDGRDAWQAYPNDLLPVPFIALVGAD